MRFLIPFLLTSCACAAEIGVKESWFEIDGKKVFLLGCSYYGGTGASEECWKRDLDEMQKCGMNWIRVWGTWGAMGKDVSAVDGEGMIRAEYFLKLKKLIEECDRRGMIVDVTLSRGNGATGPARLQTLAAHRRAVENLVRELRELRNWYLDLGNERNIRDARFVSIEDLKKLREAAKGIDWKRLITASHAGDVTKEDLQGYLMGVGVDFVSVHRPRHAKSAMETEGKVKEALGWMAEMKRVTPVHLDEPFRRGYGQWQPGAEDFLNDLRAAKAGGAAGWCFHNGSQGKEKPGRSFDLSEKGLFEQLDDQEKKLMEAFRLHKVPSAN